MLKVSIRIYIFLVDGDIGRHMQGSICILASRSELIILFY